MGWAGEAGGDEVGGFGVGFGDLGGVDLEGGSSAAAVAETSGDGAQVDAAGEEFR